VVVVAVGPLPDDLALHHRKTSPAGRLVGRPHPIAGGELDRQIQPAPRSQGLTEPLQDRWPLLRWDKLHGVHTQHAIELTPVGQLLQIVPLGGDLGELAAAMARAAPAWSTPSSERPVASTIGKYLPVPQAASSTLPVGGSLDRNRSANPWWVGSISPHWAS
jgi:hypothetical protein